jgi:hypothetical protein
MKRQVRRTGPIAALFLLAMTLMAGGAQARSGSTGAMASGNLDSAARAAYAAPITALAGARAVYTAPPCRWHDEAPADDWD